MDLMLTNVAVEFKEREFAKAFVNAYPYSPVAIRSGWLMDTKHRTPEEYRAIIEQLKNIDMDSREQLNKNRKTLIFDILIFI